MSTPAATPSTPDAYGERRVVVAQPESSEAAMSNLTKVVREEIAARKDRLQRSFDDGIAAMKADYEMKVAQFTAEHADKQARLDQYEVGINNFEAEATKATDALLGALSNARVAAAELVPTVPPRSNPPPLDPNNAPEFLSLEYRRAAQGKRRSLAPLVILAIALTAMIGVAGIGIARSQDVGTSGTGNGSAVTTLDAVVSLGALGDGTTVFAGPLPRIPGTAWLKPPMVIGAGAVKPGGAIEPIRMDADGRVLASCGRPQ